jgi:S1-C subfamily serine protease
MRDGRTLVATLDLAAAPETPPRDVRRIKSRSPFQGAEVVNLSPAVVEEMSLEVGDDAAPKGVIVDDVAADSLAANFGVQKGDIILEVNDTEIKTTRDLEDACAQRARTWDLTISRGGQVIRTRIGG